MTAHEPTPDLERLLLREKAGDFEWAFHRMIDLFVEESKQVEPRDGQIAVALLQVVMARLHEENQLRLAGRNARFNQ